MWKCGARALEPGQAVGVLLAAGLQRDRVHGHDHQPPVQPAVHAPHGAHEHRQQHLRAMCQSLDIRMGIEQHRPPSPHEILQRWPDIDIISQRSVDEQRECTP